jgi:hypothetical protein
MDGERVREGGEGGRERKRMDAGRGGDGGEKKGKGGRCDRLCYLTVDTSVSNCLRRRHGSCALGATST